MLFSIHKITERDYVTDYKRLSSMVISRLLEQKTLAADSKTKIAFKVRAAEDFPRREHTLRSPGVTTYKHCTGPAVVAANEPPVIDKEQVVIANMMSERITVCTHNSQSAIV